MIDAIVGAEVLTAAGTMGAAVVYLVRRLERLRRHNPLVALSPTPIAEANGGPVKIVGALRLIDEPLRAPLSGRACAFWDVTISAQQRGDEGTRTRDIFFRRMTSDFLVDDGTGTALVKCPPNAHLDFAIAGYHDASDFGAREAQLERFLSDHGYIPGPSDGGLRRHFERALVSGERVAVYGHGHREPDPDPEATGGTYRERPTRLVIGPLDTRLCLSNQSGVVGSTPSAPSPAPGSHVARISPP
jgi:hypothetical protein